MPSVSRKQRNFMAAAAHDPKFAKKAGVSQGVAREFNQADKGRKFAEGGEVDPRRSIVKEPGKPPRNYDPYEDLRKQYQTPGTVIRGDELPNSKPTTRPNMENSKMKQKTFAAGGKIKKGGFMKHDDAAADKKLIRNEFKRMEGIESKAEDKAVAKLAKGGKTKGYAGGGKVARGMGAALRGGKYC